MCGKIVTSTELGKNRYGSGTRRFCFTYVEFEGPLYSVGDNSIHFSSASHLLPTSHLFILSSLFSFSTASKASQLQPLIPVRESK